MPRGSGVSTSMVRRVMSEGKFTCEICGIVGYEKRFPKGGYGNYTDIPGVYLSIDHVFPKSKGGTNERSNLRILCTLCNTKKGVSCVQSLV